MASAARHAYNARLPKPRRGTRAERVLETVALVVGFALVVGTVFLAGGDTTNWGSFIALAVFEAGAVGFLRWRDAQRDKRRVEVDSVG